MEEPKLEQFELTEEQYEHLTKNEDKGHKFIKVISSVVGITAWTLILLPSESVDLVPMLWGAFVLGCISRIFLDPALWHIYVSFRKKVYEDYRNLYLYKEAKQKYDFWWIRNQKEFWASLSGKRFEQEFAFLYSKLGYEIQLTPTTADRGIDVILNKDGKTTIVQCKAHKKPVSPHVVRDLFGTLVDSHADEAILASISGFTTGVRKFVLGKNIRLISLEDIIHLQRKIIE
jgi:hypothetical protein